MKRILIVRYPLSMPPADAELSYLKTKERIGNDFMVLPFHDNVDKVEVEIVYDPQLRQEDQQVISGEGSLSWRQK